MAVWVCVGVGVPVGEGDVVVGGGLELAGELGVELGVADPVGVGGTCRVRGGGGIARCGPGVVWSTMPGCR